MSTLHLHVGLPPGRLRRTRVLEGQASQRTTSDSKTIHASVSRRDSTIYLASGSGCPSVIKVAAGISVPKQDDDRVQGTSASSAGANVVIAGEVLVQTAYHLLGKPGRLLSLLNLSDIRRYLACIEDYCQTHYLHFYHENRQLGSESRAPQQEQDGEGESQYRSSHSEQGHREEKSSVQHQRRHPTWPSMSRQKRSLKSEDSSDDEEEKRPKKINQQSEKTLRYACPFYKHNPEEFVDERSCRGPGWPTVQRVKEHVLRKHKAPDHQCPRCLKEFKDDQVLMQHFRSEETCEVKQSPSTSSQLDGNKMRLLKQRSKTTTSEDQKWYSMYRIIFPDDESSPNPYYKHEFKEPASPALPSRDVALKMFRENLNTVLSKQARGAKSSEWVLHNPQMMDVVISGAITAFDDTFAAICGQRTSPCLDDELPPIGRPILEDDASRELEVPLVADFGPTGQAPSQTEEVIEPTPDTVSNSALQYDLTTAYSIAQPPETGLYSFQQQQTQQVYLGGSVSQPEFFNVCPIARIETPLSVDLMGIRGGIIDANLVNQYPAGSRVGTEGFPHTDAQSLGPVQKSYTYNQQDLFTAKQDDFEELLQHQYQYELDTSGDLLI